MSEHKLKTCRYHPSPYPSPDDLVVAQILSIGEAEVECRLLEYNNLRATLALNHLKRGRIRSMRKIIQEGQTHVLAVINVDHNDHVSLSKKHVQPNEIEPAMKRYTQLRRLHNAIAKTAKVHQCEPIKIYQEYIWTQPFYQDQTDQTDQTDHTDQSDHTDQTDQTDQTDDQTNIYDYFNHRRSSLSNPPEPYGETLLEHLRQLFASQEIILDVKIQLYCPSPQGVNGIIKALNHQEIVDNPDINLKVTLESSPTYQIRTITTNPTEASHDIIKFIQSISTTLKSNGGFIGDHFQVEPKDYQHLFSSLKSITTTISDFNQKTLTTLTK